MVKQTSGQPMDQTFLLPDLGEGLTEAEVVRWLVAVGDRVAVDQPVVEVETAKSVVEVPSPFAGSVAVLHGMPGQTVGVGKPLITVSSTIGASPVGRSNVAETSSRETAAGDAYREEELVGSGNVLIGYGTSHGLRSGRRRQPRTPVVGPTEAMDPPVETTVQPATQPSLESRHSPSTSGQSARLVRSPLVRRLARDLGVDVKLLNATGADGVITRKDVLAAAALQALPAANSTRPSLAPPGVPAERRTPMSGFRKTVAATLGRSRSEIPEATVWVDVDASALVRLRENARTSGDPGAGLLAYLARFTIEALKAYPSLNGRVDIERGELVEYGHIHLGLAMQTDQGLLAPAVINAHAMTTAALDIAIRDLTRRARDGRATPEELASGTFTLNNYGSFNVDGSAAIINHPQVAILGFGRILDRPWVVNGEVVVRKITQMSFVFDHRVCDGGMAAGFMRAVADAVENPLLALARLG